MDNWWRDFLTFKKYITPIVMPAVFWIGVAIAIIMGLITIIEGAQARVGADARLIAWGVIILFLGPLFVRILCELVMTFFRRED